MSWRIVIFGGMALAAVAVVARAAATAKRPAGIVRGKVSWYGEGYRGKRMANGEVFDPEAMTCAAVHWPLGSLLKVRHVASGRYVIVEVTDRGPAAWTGCIVDLSSRAFRKLEDLARGKFLAEVEVLREGPEPARPAPGADADKGGAR